MGKRWRTLRSGEGGCCDHWGGPLGAGEEAIREPGGDLYCTASCWGQALHAARCARERAGSMPEATQRALEASGGV